MDAWVWLHRSALLFCHLPHTDVLRTFSCHFEHYLSVIVLQARKFRAPFSVIPSVARNPYSDSTRNTRMRQIAHGLTFPVLAQESTCGCFASLSMTAMLCQALLSWRALFSCHSAHFFVIPSEARNPVRGWASLLALLQRCYLDFKQEFANSIL